MIAGDMAHSGISLEDQDLTGGPVDASLSLV